MEKCQITITAGKYFTGFPTSINIYSGGNHEKDQEIFQERLNHHHDELRWLYTELYHNDDMFAELCDQMYQYFTARRRALKNRDLEREKSGLVPPEGYAWHDALY